MKNFNTYILTGVMLFSLNATAQKVAQTKAEQPINQNKKALSQAENQIESAPKGLKSKSKVQHKSKNVTNTKVLKVKAVLAEPKKVKKKPLNAVEEN